MTLAAPFPYFGWGALGDPSGYVEPFAGSAAVLLARPPFSGRRVETLNDADGWLVNVWRSIQLDPAEVVRHAWGPVAEIDYHARLAWLQERRSDGLVSWLTGATHDRPARGRRRYGDPPRTAPRPRRQRAHPVRPDHRRRLAPRHRTPRRPAHLPRLHPTGDDMTTDTDDGVTHAGRSRGHQAIARHRIPFTDGEVTA